jgi:O-succinylbenzoic acid--CoA ligase
LLSGYLEDGRLRDPRDGDGWFATGDLGTLDGGGRLTVAGRRDRMFISGGENIHPEEIELALLAIDGVVEALVEPIAHPEFGQRPAAFVRLEPENALTSDDLARELAARLPRFKIPDRLGRLPGREPL